MSENAQRFDINGKPLKGSVMVDECGACGMPLLPREFHPYAACALFNDTHDSQAVWSQFHLISRHVQAVATDA